MQYVFLKSCRGFARKVSSSITPNAMKTLKMFPVTSILVEVILFPNLLYQCNYDTHGH